MKTFREQDARVLTNDKLIRSWNGTEILQDKQHPRVAIELTRREY